MLPAQTGAVAANMIVVQCNSCVPISLACSGRIGSSLEHGITGTAFRGDLKGPRSGSSSLETVSSTAMKHQLIELGNGVILPYAVQDQNHAERQCNHYARGTTTAREFFCPNPQPRRPLEMHILAPLRFCCGRVFMFGGGFFEGHG